MKQHYRALVQRLQRQHDYDIPECGEEKKIVGCKRNIFKSWGSAKPDFSI
jgi:hypothetical protein